MAENKEKFIEEIVSLTSELISKIGIEGSISVMDDESQDHCLVVSINTTQKVDDFMQRGGTGLRSAEHILRAIAGRRIPKEIRNNFILDLNDYRKTKTNYIVHLAKETADRVRMSKRAEALSPMSSYERRLVHMELASYSDITTESIGEDPKRRIVIKPL